MRQITIFLSNSEVLKFKSKGTTPHLQRIYALGTKINVDEGEATIEATTIEN